MGEVIFDAFICDPIQVADIDLGVFQRYLGGWTLDDVTLDRKKELFSQYDAQHAEQRKAAEGTGSTGELATQLERLMQCYARDFEDQFRVFPILEHFLKRPMFMTHHGLLQMSVPLQRTMINMCAPSRSRGRESGNLWFAVIMSTTRCSCAS